MNKFYTLILSVLTFSLGINAQITELFFSEYAEGSSNNKYLEIYNGTSSTISLDNYAFPNTSNGADVTGQPDYWNTFPTGASIAPGDVYIIAHPQADPSILAHADHTYTYLSNGDDGFALVSGGTLNDANGNGSYDPGEMTGYTLLDHIGNWGADPGSGWDVAGVTNGTKDHTLVRKASVTGPNPCWDQTCGNSSAGTNATDSEWIVYPNETWTYLGSHSTILQDFSSLQNVAVVDVFGAFGGGLAASNVLEDDPVAGASNKVRKATQSAGGDIWKGVFFRPHSHYIDLTNNQTVSINVYSTTATNFKGKIQAGTSSQADIELTTSQPHTGSGWETLSFDFTGATGEWGELVLFVNVDANGAFIDPAVQAFDVFFDDISANQGSAIPAPSSGPTNNAADPTPLAADVISIFSDTYTDVSGSDFNPNWGQNGHGSVNASFDPGTGNTVLAYTNFNYQGIQFGSNQDISPMEYLHVDIWVEGTFNPRVFVISGGTEVPHTITNTGANNWISADIPVTGITGNLSNCYQFKFDGGNGSTDAIYVDNLYFWRTPGYNPNPPSTVDITFEVNTANIINNGDVVGANGIYVGGGVVGDAQALALTQSTTDPLLWTGVYTAPLSLLSQANTSAYVLLNSPNDGGDWGKKENLNGLPCGAAAFNDRYFPVITSDTTLKLCFGSCETDGSCPPPPASFVDITLTVNTSNITVDPAGIFLAGGGNFGNPGDNPLTQDANNSDLWTITVTKAQGFSSYYIFTNGNAGDYSGKEQLGGLPCGDPTNYNDRFMGPIQSDTTIQHCFGTCVFDGTCPSLNDCGVTGTYDYGNNEDVSNAVGFTANAGDYITLDFSAGITESCCDDWFIMDAADGTGNVIATGAGSIVGTYTSTTGEISFYVDSDGSWSPAGGGGTAGVTHATFVYSVSCSAPPACPDPSGLAANNITSDGADISWTVGGTESAWNLEYGAPGFTQGSGTIVNVTTNPYSMTGLTANTAYDVYLQADCGNGDLSAWVGPISFTTACLTLSSFPFTETFEDASTTRECWSNIQEVGTSDWTYGSGSSGGSITTAFNGTKNAVYVSASGSRITKLVSPIMDLSSLTTPRVSFYYGQQSWFGDQNELKLYYRDSPSGTWTEIWTDASDVSSWTQAVVTLPSHTSTYQIAFEGINAYGHANVLDDVTIEESPSCVAPTALAASNITSSSADLNWTAGGTETAWNIEYGVTGFAQGSGTIVNITTNPYSMTSLTSNTSYDVYIQADCGSGSTSTWSGPVSFTTNPACGDNVGPICYGPGSYILFSASVDNPGDFITIDVIAGETEAGYDDLEIYEGIGITGNVLYDSDGDHTGISITSTTGDITVYIDGDGSYNCEDGVGGPYVPLEFTVSCTAPPSCVPPSGLTLNNLSSSSADLSWTAGGTETAWNLEYGITGFTQGTGTTANITTNPYTISGLTANTTYDVYLQADCGGGDVSTWSGPISFTTSCAPISNFPFRMNFAYPNEWECWSTNGSWYYFSTNGTNADTAAGLLNNVVHDDHFITPEFTVTDEVSDRFSLMSNGFGSVEYYEILVSTTASNSVSDFLDTVATDVTTLDINQYSYEQFDLSAYEGQNIRLAIHAYSPLGASWYHLFDDVRIDGYFSDTVNETVSACDSYTWYDSTYTNTGSDTLFLAAQDSTDSDSTLILNLTIYNSSVTTETVTSCDSYTWSGDGNTYSATGIYVANLQTVDGCDSTATLDLTITNSSSSTETISACDSYTWNGLTFTTSGNQTQTLTNSVGCDSVANLVLTINSSTSSLLTTSSCNSYDWNGNTYTTSGMYVATSVNSFNCPQIDSLDLTITTSSTSLTQAACDSFAWNGTNYTTSGTYTNASGSCVDTLFLTVNSSSSSVTNSVVCDSLNWNGINYLASGSYTYLTTNISGCDSLASLNLTVNNSVSNSLSLTVCDHYIWNGDTLTASGVYVDTLQTSSSCDSVVTVNLTVNNSDVDTVTVFACEDYTWNGNTYSSTGNYTDTLTSSVTGCDSIVTLSLTINVTVASFSESFDNIVGLPTCWSQDSSDIFDWSLNSGPTGSGGTGPSSDVSGSGNYMYIETSSPRIAGDVAILHTGNIDIGNLTNPELRFFSHMYGSAIGTLTVELWDGTSYNTVFTKSGDHGDQWNEELVLLTSSSNIVSFRITAVTDSNSVGDVWPGDIAIDEFGVREALANDLALVAAAVSSDCELTATEPVEVWVVNEGLVAQTGFDLSFGVNGAAATVETVTSTLNPGDTLMYVFNATADMSTDDMMYNFTFHVDLSTDQDTLDNHISASGENIFTPLAPTVMGDTICNGDTAMISANANGYVTWFDAATGGNQVGEGEDLMVSPTATTSYFAETKDAIAYFQDFDSFNDGDLISVVDGQYWTPWPAATVTPAAVTSSEGNGGNSLLCDNAVTNDPVLEYGEAISSGYFYFSVDMKIIDGAYFNMQENVAIGTAWSFDLVFDNPNGTVDVSIDQTSVLTGSYTGTNPTGDPVWITVELEADYDTGTWELFINGNSIGTFINFDPVASANFYPRPAPDSDVYYLDNIEFFALKDDACVSTTRTEAVVTVEDCSNINELSFKDLNIYPNPNNGQFTIANSELISEVFITDLQGKTVYSNTNVNSQNLNIEMDYLERGMYMINIKTETDNISKTIVVQ